MSLKPRRGNNTPPRHAMPLLLPVRTKFAPLQALKAWLLQCWRRWRTKRIVIQPPLQPGRHKPFPQRPHQARRQSVFDALDAAPVEFTRRQLIAYVRIVTGVGCSEKLIAQWRKARRGDVGTRRHGAAEIERQGRANEGRGAMGLLLCLALNACGTTTTLAPPPSSTEITISPAPSEEPDISNLKSPISNPPGPRLLRIKLTINAPHELQVKAGQHIEAGDVLSNHTQARQRLLVQKRALQTARHHLNTQMQLTTASLRQLNSLGLGLPPTTFAAEQAAIQRAEAEAVAVHRAVEIQRQRVSSYESLVSGETDALPYRNPKPEPRNLITAHETAKLTQAQERQLLAQAEIELHQAKLATAREVRAWDEQKHRVEVTRQLLNARSQQQQAAIERARLAAQLAEVDVQLAQLTEIRAPFAGTIKRIEWEDMHDEKIIVVVYLLLGSR